jgi:hypothetical protein
MYAENRRKEKCFFRNMHRNNNNKLEKVRQDVRGEKTMREHLLISV